MPFVPTTALVVRRTALDAVEGFDETMRFGEDVDFVWRLATAGWTVRYEPRVQVGHPGRPTTGAWLRQRFDYGTSAAPLARKHGTAVAPLAVSAWSAFAWAFAGVGHPVEHGKREALVVQGVEQQVLAVGRQQPGHGHRAVRHGALPGRHDRGDAGNARPPLLRPPAAQQ